MSQRDDQPFSQERLQSPQYRQKLMRKLNTLIAVLEVASAKVRRSLAGPDPDIARLTRIKKNLQDTLGVCLRAKRALEKHKTLPKELSESLAEVVSEPIPNTGSFEVETGSLPTRRPMPPGSRYEMLSWDEHLRFRKMGPIDSGDIGKVDFDALESQFQELSD